MYRLILILLVSITYSSFAQESTPISCQGNMGKYCRPTSPRKYGPPHNDYRRYKNNVATSPPNPASEGPSREPVKTFEDLAQNLIAAESAIRRYCLNDSVADVKEVYRVNDYALIYTLRGQDGPDVAVRIKHRVIYVTIEKAGVTILKDLKILPNILNTAQATWVHGNGYLEVFIPYAQLESDVSERCQNVNLTLINVPQSNSPNKQGDSEIEENQPLGTGSNLNSARYTGTPNTKQEVNYGYLQKAIADIFSSDEQELIDVRNNAVL